MRRILELQAYTVSLDDLSISIITAHELIVGARNRRDAESIDSLIQSFPVQSELDARITGRRTNYSNAMPSPMVFARLTL